MLKLHYSHPWHLTVPEAIYVQEELAPLVMEDALGDCPATVAGVDMSVRGDRVQAAVVVLRVPELNVVDSAIWRGPVQFPYVPGLLSFREAPAVLEALAQLSQWPDLIMADAQGRAHPRRFGLASHLGVLLDMPTIGVAKSRLIGKYEMPSPGKGATTPLLDGDETIGTVVRTRANVKPLFVSIGHRITLAQAVEWVLNCLTRYRLPEPTRQAHLLSKHGVLGTIHKPGKLA